MTAPDEAVEAAAANSHTPSATQALRTWLLHAGFGLTRRDAALNALDAFDAALRGDTDPSPAPGVPAPVESPALSAVVEASAGEAVEAAAEVERVLVKHTPFSGDSDLAHGFLRCGCTYGPDRVELPPMTWPQWSAHVASILTPTLMALGENWRRTAEAAMRAHAEAEERAEKAEAEAHNYAADYDRRGERLWRLAALAGHVPSDADNDASAEHTIATALADLAAAEQRGAEKARADLRERLNAASGYLLDLGDNADRDVDVYRLNGKVQGVRLALSYVDEAARIAAQPGEAGS